MSLSPLTDTETTPRKGLSKPVIVAIILAGALALAIGFGVFMHFRGKRVRQQNARANVIAEMNLFKK